MLFAQYPKDQAPERQVDGGLINVGSLVNIEGSQLPYLMGIVKGFFGPLVKVYQIYMHLIEPHVLSQIKLCEAVSKLIPTRKASTSP